SAAALRNHPLGSGSRVGALIRRKRPNVNLGGAGFVGLVGDKTGIWGETANSFSKGCAQKRNRFPITRVGHRQDPQICLRLWINVGIEQIAPVSRPTGGNLIFVGLQQDSFFSGSISRFLIYVQVPVAIRCERDAFPVGRPDGGIVTPWIEREARARPAQGIQHPNVRASLLKVKLSNGNVRPIRRDCRIGISASFSDSTVYFPLRIKPGEL